MSPTHKLLCSMIVVLVVILVGTYKYTTEQFHGYTSIYSSLAAIHKQACSIPVLDPFDPSIQQFFRTPEPLECNIFPSIVYVDDNSILHSNKSAFSFFNFSASDTEITCDVRSVRLWTNATGVSFGNPYTINLPAKLKESDFNHIQCKHKGVVVFDNIVAGISDNRDATISKPILKDESGEYLSVHLIGLDSVSRSASIRALPKTLEYLKTLGSYDFRGVMKIGDNTPPNLFGLLTGQLLHRWDHDAESSFLWNKFSDNSYVTLHAEDNARSYLLERGFDIVRTDHYMRTFWQGLLDLNETVWFNQSSGIHRILQEHTPSKFCQQNTKSFVKTFNYLKRFLTHYTIKRKFTFTMFAEVSHDDMNYLPYIDEDLVNFLRWLKGGNFMNNSIVVLFADHGPRYDGLRDTTVGRIEARMPLLHVLVPEHIKEKYPEVETSLTFNTERLVTLFDVHQTLIDVLNSDYGTPSTQFVNGKKRGVSLFKTISEARSCKEADIPMEYCACYNMSNIIDLKHNRYFVRAAEGIVDHLNNMLSAEPKCQTLQLMEALSAENISSGLDQADTFRYNKHSFLRFLISPAQATHAYNIRIETKPGFAMFDVTCELDSEGNLLRVVNVDRTNAYGNQSHCVTDEALRQYCYC